MIAGGTVVRVLQAGNMLGEGVTWAHREGALYWTDIEAATLWRYRPADREVRQWLLPERLASFALCSSEGWLLLGLSKRLALFHLDSCRLIHVADVEPSLPTRLNDGACDREGRFVCGTMDTSNPCQAIGGLYRLDTDFSLERLPLGDFAISNSLAFSPNGRALYFSDSARRTIQRCAYARNGDLGPPQMFVDLGAADGVPDGAAVDAEGCLWSAHWGMGRIVRYRADGTEDMRIRVPVSQPTRVAFGGPDLRTLFITSAREGLTDAELRREGSAGDLFAIEPGPRGVVEPLFAGDPERLAAAI